MVWFYRCLLRAYPRSMRATYGAEMTSAFAAAWERAARHGARARVRFIGRLFHDFFASLAGAWRPRPPAAPHRRKDLMIFTLVREFRQAARVLWHHRASTAAMVVTLALAIGATTAVFSVVHAVILRPLPYANPSTLVRVYERNIPRDVPRNVVAPANFLQWRDRAAAFSSMAAFVDDTVTLTGDGPAELLDLRYVTWNMFDLLGVNAAAGRTFRATEADPNAPRKAMISWRLWQRRYHGDPAIVGRSLRFDGQPMEVVGVLPAGFRLFGEDPDVYWQIREIPAMRQPRGRSWNVIGRLKPGVSLATARAEMNQLSEQLERQWPAFDTGWRSNVVSLRDALAGDARLPLYLLLAAVGIVLAAGCANITNLLLARASARRREMALRTALGASRWRVVGQLLAEGFLLAALGAAAGLAVARVTLAGIAPFAASLGIPRLDESSLDAAVLAVALGITAASALVFSLVPAFQLLRRDVSAGLASGGRWSTGARGEQRIRQLLVVGQIACAVMLVIGGALVARSLAALVAVDTGFDPRTYTFTVSMPGARYAAPDAKPRFYQQVLDRLQGSGGIEAIGGVVTLPLRGMGTATGVTRPDQPPPALGQEAVADVRAVIGDYFTSMRIPIVRGRSFSAAELATGAKVCVISEAAVRELFPHEDPIGKFLSVQLNGGPDEIIGVVGDIHHRDLVTTPRSLVYYTYARVPFSGVMHFTVRSALDERTLGARVTAAVDAIDPDIPVTDAGRMLDAIGGTVASPRIATGIVAGFAGLALLLSLVGIGALLAAVVASRVPEFGVRLALGARPSDIRRMVLAQGGWLIGAGLVIGIAGAAAASSALGSLLFAVRALDPVTYAAVSAAIAALALIAADIPARRATRTNPANVLRS